MSRARADTGLPRHSARAEVITRRAKSISVVVVGALGSILALPLALPALVVVDLVRLRPKLPLARLYAFGLCWAWLETVGILAATGLWLTGRGGDAAAHYRLQAWWAGRLMASLRATCGVRPDVAGADALLPGPTVLFVRHASLADSLLTAWVIIEAVGMHPRIVMKRELLADPCLDIVGNRLPNCFVDRAAADSAPELAAIEAMTEGLAQRDVAVLFPEGTRANPAKRARALDAIRRSDPQRAERMGALVNLLPPKPGGAAAMLGASPGAAVCIGWHVGFEGLDTFGGIIDALGRGRSRVAIRFERVGRPDVAAEATGGAPARPPDGFADWLDDVWLHLDEAVQVLLSDTTAK